MIKVTIYKLTFEGKRRFSDSFPSSRTHNHLNIFFWVFLLETSRVAPTVKSTLHAFKRLILVFHTLSFTEHITNLLQSHIDSIFFEKCSDLAAIQCAATILVELLKHIIDDFV